MSKYKLHFLSIDIIYSQIRYYNNYVPFGSIHDFLSVCRGVVNKMSLKLFETILNVCSNKKKNENKKKSQSGKTSRRFPIDSDPHAIILHVMNDIKLSLLPQIPKNVYRQYCQNV